MSEVRLAADERKWEKQEYGDGGAFVVATRTKGGESMYDRVEYVNLVAIVTSPSTLHSLSYRHYSDQL